MPADFCKNCWILLGTVVMLNACQADKGEDMLPPELPLTPYTLNSPEYFPALTIPANNSLTVEGIELGRRLYYDTILSRNGRSCSGCHNQDFAFSRPDVNSQPHMNLAWNNKFLWNGYVEGSLEDAMMFEVEEFFHTDLDKLNKHPNYPAMFRRVFSAKSIGAKEVAYALAQFVRTQASTNSKFDKYMRYEAGLSPSEMRGFVLYNTEKGDCFHCHSLGLFNDNAFHNIGLDAVFAGAGLGRYNVSGNPDDMGKFKTPSLRNVEVTAPYMHDGRYATLEEVIEHYNSRVKISPTLDPILTKPNHQFGLQLSEQDKADLLAFLKALTDSSFLNDPNLAKP